MNYLQRNIADLCQSMDGVIKPDNSVNVTKAAELIGIPQPTLKRILDGDHNQVRPNTENIIANFFGVSVQDLYSEIPINLRKQEDLECVIGLANRLNDNDQLELLKSLRVVKKLKNV